MEPKPPSSPSFHQPARRRALAALAAATGGAATAAVPVPPAAPDAAALAAELRAAETAFAATMARRDVDAFAAFVAEHAVFINGGQPLRGRRAVVQHWSRYFSEPQAPFAWQPELVEVVPPLGLGYTEGPVTSPGGVVFARFYSTWQRQPSGQWQVVFDNGYEVCKPAAAG